MRSRVLVLVALVVVTATFGCSNEALDDCADCPDPDFRDACLEAAADCDQFSGDDREECLEEARALCE
ncbi:MAG: hypothetical protein AAGF92_19905 [Myxococcota bacterium]